MFEAHLRQLVETQSELTATVKRIIAHYPPIEDDLWYQLTAAVDVTLRLQIAVNDVLLDVKEMLHGTRD